MSTVRGDGGDVAEGDKEAGLGASLHRAGVRSAGLRRHERHDAPSILLIGAALAVAVGLAAAAAAGGGSVPAALAIAALVPAAVVDVRERRLPDRLVAGGGVVLLAATIVTGSFEVTSMAAGAVVFAGPILLLHLVSPAAMGFGDVKLAVVLGAAIGLEDWRLTLAVLCLASALGAGVGWVRRSGTVAFGTHLVLASAVVLLAAPHLDPLRAVPT